MIVYGSLLTVTNILVYQKRVLLIFSLYNLTFRNDVRTRFLIQKSLAKQFNIIQMLDCDQKVGSRSIAENPVKCTNSLYENTKKGQ